MKKAARLYEVSFFLHYEWFFQDLGKEAERTFMHTTVHQKSKIMLNKGATIATLNSDTREAMPCFREVLESIGTNHFNTLKHLMIHLQKVAQRSKDTGMSSKNLAIVWAPNLIKTSLSTHGIFIE